MADTNNGIRASVKYRHLSKGPASTYIKYIFDVCLNNYPPLPLKELLSEIKTGKTPSKTKSQFYSGELNLNWFKPQDIGKDIYLTNSTDKLSNSCLLSKSVTIFKINTLLVTCIGDIGRIGILKTQSSANQQITGLLFNEEKLLSEFAYFYFLSHRELLEENQVSTTLPIINQKLLLKLQMPKPTLSVQKQLIKVFLNCLKSQENNVIPEYLSEYKDYNYELCVSIFQRYYGNNILLNKIPALNELVDKLKQSILKDAIQGKLVPQDPNDEPAEKLLERIRIEKEKLIKEKKLKRDIALLPIRNDEIPYELPVGWKFARLGEIGSWGAGSTPDRSNPDYYNGTIPWLKTGELNDGHISKSEESITLEAFKKNNLKLRNPGDVLMAMYGATIGKLGILDINATTNQACCACTTYTGINNEYLFYYLLSKRQDLINLGFGGAQPNISKDKIINLLIPIPPTKNQIKIVNKIKYLLEICKQQENRLTEAKDGINKLNQAVLREAFSSGV